MNSNFWTPQLQAALWRALAGATLAAAAAIIAALVSGADYKAAFLAGGSAAVVYLAARGGFEGISDGRRAAKGAVQPSDVGYYGHLRPPRG